MWCGERAIKIFNPALGLDSSGIQVNICRFLGQYFLQTGCPFWCCANNLKPLCLCFLLLIDRMMRAFWQKCTKWLFFVKDTRDWVECVSCNETHENHQYYGSMRVCQTASYVNVLYCTLWSGHVIKTRVCCALASVLVAASVTSCISSRSHVNWSVNSTHVLIIAGSVGQLINTAFSYGSLCCGWC